MDRIEVEPEQINVHLEQPSANESGLLYTEILSKQKKQTKSKYKQWKQNGITITGGNNLENELDQLYEPHGILIDDKAIIIVDHRNHRILEWKIGSQTGEIIAGGNESGDKLDQLAQPVDVILDKQNDSLIICDRNNERVMRWFRKNETNPQVFIPNIDCYGLAMDNNGSIYVTDWKKSTVTRWKEGEINGTVVAGGNGEGDRLNQLNFPAYIFVDKDYSLYISDNFNHRVVKWRNGAKEGTKVAGGNERGNSLMQLSSPQGVFVDDLGLIYVVDHYNHRIMRWCEGDKQGSVVVGGNDQGQRSDQLDGPVDLSFDAEGNLYVSDSSNDRIQKFELCVTETIC
ncbi:unnamed protein product [Adineta steineri]|uniref:Uncharacterized protein n=1 Tax=Adineta steineri TaxID=433720 RepID=A0A818JTY3_9BILA|nr:unnamed protein product [Adineta steineri]CAF3540819.1 unnamed protein product [Adineta steineri]CAF3820401.1 unnamed protein product [Adineta steineri]